MNTSQWLQVLLVGAVAGAVGQLLRAIAGLANASRNAAGPSSEMVDMTRLFVSTLVGATAGALAAITMESKLRGTDIASEVILGLVAAGYAGADFIEGIAGKFGKAQGASSATNPVSALPQPAAAPASATASSLPAASTTRSATPTQAQPPAAAPTGLTMQPEPAVG